jgi:flavin-dependent dehydrogenase
MPGVFIFGFFEAQVMISQYLNGQKRELDCAVMIVGAGPAGISSWLHLQKYAPQLARRSIVLERAIFPRDKLCAGGLGAWSGAALKYLEIELNIPSVYISDIDFRIANEFYHFHQADCFRVVPRADFDHALAQAAVNRGLELHEGEFFTDVYRNRRLLIVKTNKRNYSVQTLIGADGALSSVRRKMMPSNKPHLAATLQIFAPAEPHYDPEFNEKKITLNLAPVSEGLQGYLWHVPCLNNGKPSMAHGIVDFRIYPDRPRANIKKIFGDALRSRNLNHKPGSWSSYPISWFSKENTISKPNILLVGDAAGVEPALGGGIHISLSYGEVAAHTIINAFQNNDFSFQDYKQRLYSHLVGKVITDNMHLAIEMYGGKENPLNIIRKLFPEKNEHPDLLSLFFSGASV